MDQAFAPGNTEQNDPLRRLFASRDSTPRQTSSRAPSIKDVFEFLEPTNLTADDLVAGSRASREP